MSIGEIDEGWDSEAYQRAAELVAKRLASFRLGLDADDPYAFTHDELMRAVLIVGTLSAAGFMAPRI